MPKPHRLQLSRRKGFRLAKGVIVVARPTKWGNPHKPGKLARAETIAKYRRDLIAGKLKVSIDDARRELKSYNLACWCSLDGPCHADVLIEFANRK